MANGPARTRRVVPNLGSTDPGASVRVLREILGLEVVMDLGWVVTLAAPDVPHAQVSVLARDATAPVVADLSVEVDDVDAAFAAARARGLPIEHPLTDEPWGVRRFLVREPGGRVINVLAHRTGAPGRGARDADSGPFGTEAPRV